MRGEIQRERRLLAERGAPVIRRRFLNVYGTSLPFVWTERYVFPLLKYILVLAV